MTRSFLAFTAALAAAATAAAQPPAGLKLVPPDAAVFVHADVAKIWQSKLGDTFRKVRAKSIDEGLTFLKETAGVTPADVKSLTFFVPKVKTDGPPPFGLIVDTAKPYNRDKIVGYLRGLSKKDKDGFEEQPGSKYLVAKSVLFDMGDPQSFRVFFQHKEISAAPAAGDGPLAPAMKAVAAGSPFVLGVAFGNLPDEIRKDDLPAEVRPFQPFFFSEAGILTADLANGELVVNARFKNASRAKAVEAEKSLGALKTLVQTALEFGLKEVQKNDDKGQLALVDFMKDLQAVVREAVIANDDNTPSAKLTAKADLNYAPFLEFVFGRVGSASDRMMDANNLKQIGLAMHNYASTYGGAFPAAALVGKKGKPLLSWRVAVLPYLDQGELYKKFKLDEPWDSEHNKKVLADNPMPKVFQLPGAAAKPDEKKTHYQVFTGNGALFDVIEGVKIQNITDGTSNTIMVGTAKTPVEWTKPADMEFDPKQDPRDLLLFVNDVCSIAFADGSVRSIAKKAKVETWRALITKAGGEVVDQ